MGWFSSSSQLPEPKLSADGAPIAPDRTQRARCWEGRDAYFKCLDRNEIIDSLKEKDKADKACAQEEKGFEANCATSWVCSSFVHLVQEAVVCGIGTQAGGLMERTGQILQAEESDGVSEEPNDGEIES